ncbi:pleckstrin homology domain-containing family M member 1 isoform X2 [Periplaneta americana]|uniref:pleckstrin homology domain-containing family M member 1 isoform X2 n=1 Tax=Periplaneta americana TaxID=6978 RepID=UPI0037E8FF6B
MNSLLRSVTSLGGREDLVKESLISQLSTSVKEVQLEMAQTQGNGDITASLCTVLEAVFIHGLKDTFMNRVSQAIGADPDQRPEPSYWGPLLIFSHREIIDQINALNLITTDVGRCRAWLRLALNDGLLSSYLESMRRDGSALKPYYRRSAFLRDTDMLDVAQRLVEGLESCPLSIACNSSLLNVWTNPPLLLAGLWTPPLRSCPVVSGVDVASTLDSVETAATDDSVSSAVSLSSHSYEGSGLGTMLALNEDEALKIILGTPVDDAPLVNSAMLLDKSDSNEENANIATNECVVENTSSQGTDIPSRNDKNDDSFGDDDGPSSVGNSLVGRAGWSSSFEEVPDTAGEEATRPREVDVAPSASRKSITSITRNKSALLRSPSEVQSYHSLLESYNLLSGSYVKTPDLRDFMQRFEGSESATDTTLGTEAEDPEFGSLVQQLGKLATEPGLDNQNYTCKGCGHPVGMNFGKARVCSFSGGYFCSECHVGEEWVIPARAIHNWDFRRYPVARRSAAFLEEIQHHPLLDLKGLNPRLYLAVEDMTQLQTLRIQLNLLRAYLFTCREPVIEELQKRVWPREYLYEHVHLYSVADLLQIPSGQLAQLLHKVVAFAKGHVLSCWLCSQKGFICEVCNNPKVIYPFDMESTYRCGVCSAVFHVGCLDATKPCPKCERRQKREDLPLLEGDS